MSIRDLSPAQREALFRFVATIEAASAASPPANKEDAAVTGDERVFFRELKDRAWHVGSFGFDWRTAPLPSAAKIPLCHIDRSLAGAVGLASILHASERARTNVEQAFALDDKLTDHLWSALGELLDHAYDEMFSVTEALRSQP